MPVERAADLCFTSNADAGAIRPVRRVAFSGSADPYRYDVGCLSPRQALLRLSGRLRLSGGRRAPDRTAFRASGQRIPRAPLTVGALAAALVVVALLLVSSSGGSFAPSVHGGSFTTRYSAGWTLRDTQPARGVTVYALSSNGAQINDLGIPAPGAIGVTIAEYPVAMLVATGAPTALLRNPLTILPHVIGIPRVAENASVTAPLHRTSLAGTPAASIAYSYTYGGVGDAQIDTVARHGATIVSIEMDTEPSLGSQGAAAMARVISNWHWQ